MENLQFTIAAGETKRIERSGRYVEILAAGGRLTLDLETGDGGRGRRLQRVQAGAYSKTPFGAISVTNVESAAQSVDLLIADNESGTRRSPGVVEITNAVATGSFWTEDYTATLSIGFSSNAILSPGSNVRGMRIRKAMAFGRAGASGIVRLGVLAGPSAPAQFPSSGLPLVYLLSNNSTMIESEDSGHINLQVPAGWGLWVTTSHEVSAATYAQAVVSYETL